VTDLIRQMGITEQTYYRSKKTYGRLEPEQVREMKQVLDETPQLKKLVAGFNLDKAVLQDVPSNWSAIVIIELVCHAGG